MVNDPLGLTPTAEELIDEISAAFVEHNEPPPNSFTLYDFIELTKARSRTSAERYLTDLVKTGKLNKVRIGKKNFYYKPGGA